MKLLKIDIIASNINKNSKDIEDLVIRKFEKNEFLEFKNKLLLLIENKVDLVEVQTALNSAQDDISKRLGEYRNDIRLSMQQLDSDFKEILDKKASINEVNDALNTKADAIVVNHELKKKLSLEELEEVKILIERLARDLDNRIFKSEFESNNTIIKLSLEDMNKELVLKSNIKDVCTLLDMKSNIDDVNKALSEIHKELDAKHSNEELKQWQQDQSLINETLCGESCVARWIWKSGEVKSG